MPPCLPSSTPAYSGLVRSAGTAPTSQDSARLGVQKNPALCGTAARRPAVVLDMVYHGYLPRVVTAALPTLHAARKQPRSQSAVCLGTITRSTRGSSSFALT